MLWWLPEEEWDAVTGCAWDKLKWALLLKINAQMSSIWAKGCMLMIVCVLSDFTWPPLLGGGRKSWYIIISVK